MKVIKFDDEELCRSLAAMAQTQCITLATAKRMPKKERTGTQNIVADIANTIIQIRSSAMQRAERGGA